MFHAYSMHISLDFCGHQNQCLPYMGHRDQDLKKIEEMSLFLNQNSYGCFKKYQKFKNWCTSQHPILLNADVQKDYLCPGTQIWLRNVLTIPCENSLNDWLKDLIGGGFGHENLETGLIFSISKQCFQDSNF